MYSGDEYYGDDVTSPLDDEPLCCESCGEPLDADDAVLVGEEMWCEHCADECPDSSPRPAGRAWQE